VYWFRVATGKVAKHWAVKDDLDMLRQLGSRPRNRSGVRELGCAALKVEAWQGASRGPYMLETSLPGAFAAVDVRSGSIKRLVSALGEGSMAVRFVHQYLADAAARVE
jgi:thioredoxin reductase